MSYQGGVRLRSGAVAVLLAGSLLAGCTSMPDIVSSTVPVGEEHSGKAFTSVAEVKGRLMDKKRDLAGRIRNEDLKRQGWAA